MATQECKANSHCVHTVVHTPCTHTMIHTLCTPVHTLCTHSVYTPYTGRAGTSTDTEKASAHMQNAVMILQNSNILKNVHITRN